MAYTNLTVDQLKNLLREHGVRGYSNKNKAELIAMAEQAGIALQGIAPIAPITPIAPISPAVLNEQVAQIEELVDRFIEEPRLIDDPLERVPFIRTLNTVDNQALRIVLQEDFGVQAPDNTTKDQLINMIIDDIRKPPARSVIGVVQYYQPTLGFLYTVVTNPDLANDPETERIVRQVFEPAPYQNQALVGYMAQLMPDLTITPQMTPEELTHLFLEEVRAPRA